MYMGSINKYLNVNQYSPSKRIMFPLKALVNHIFRMAGSGFSHGAHFHAEMSVVFTQIIHVSFGVKVERR
jgi:hypothetical protein